MSEIQFPQRHDYTPISPFKMFVKSNFPFIEATFESLDNYGLYCKVVEYLNQVIGETNDMATDVVAFTDFTTNYFENLDVQEEINNKLDEMASTGVLQQLISNYFSEVNDAINTQNAKIASLSESQPIFVSSTSSMTEHDKIYVLTDNNHIYQYSTISSAFIDTGAIYSLREDGLPAISTLVAANNYETVLPDLNQATSSAIYELLFALNADAVPSNLPVAPQGKIETLFVIKIGTSNVKQIYFGFDQIFSRFKYNNSWSSWENQKNDNNSRVINTSNYLTYLPDINNISKTCNYFLTIPAGTASSGKPAHLPNAPTSGNLEILTTEIINSTTTLQILMSNQYIYIRNKYSNTWGNWFKISGNYNATVSNANYSYLLPDLDDLSETCAYTLLFGTGVENKPAHLPVAPSSKVEFLYHFNYGREGYQLYFSDNNIYTRWRYHDTWQNWKNINESILQTIPDSFDISKSISVGENETYTTLKSAIEYGVQYPNTKVYIKEGVYDLYEEFGGDTFFDSYDSTSSKGLTLSNGIHLIFSSDSKVTFNNTNNNEYIPTRFSPFNAGQKGFTIENLTIETSKCRYCIHDERGSSEEQYINKIINSNFYHDNTNGGYGACIGGGLGKSGEIIIENCIFENPNASSTDSVVSYHNNNSATETGSKSNVVVKDNYFKHGTFRASWCGVSTPITNFIITNNKLAGAIIHRAERETDVVENTSITAWNNITS